MSWLFTVNNTITQYYQEHIAFKNLLVAQGWTVVSSSTGKCAFSPSFGGGDLWSTPAQLFGAGSFLTAGSGDPPYNSNAWTRLRCPGSTREFLLGSSIIFNNTGGQPIPTVYLAYSPIAGFTTGSGLSTFPTSADQWVLQNGNFAIFPFYPTYPGGGKTYMAAGGVAEGYAFYSFGIHITTFFGSNTGNTYAGFYMDSVLSGSGIPNDPDPVLIGASGNDIFANGLQIMFGGGNSPHNAGFYSSSNGPGMFGHYAHRLQTTNNQTLFSINASNIPPDQINHRDPYIPISWCRTQEERYPVGFKGLSTMMKLAGWQNRQNYTILSEITTGDRIFVNNVSLPWNGGPFFLT